MSDIIKVFAEIGSHYLEDEKRVKNKAYEYETIKVYLFDIQDKSIEPHLNIDKSDLIYTDFGKSPRQGFLYPILHLDTKNIDKMIRNIKLANTNLLSYFSEQEIESNEILVLLSATNNEDFFTNYKEKITKLEKYKAPKGRKVATYIALSYKNKPISAYFISIYEQHLNKSSSSSLYGFDILSNEKGIGGDANLAFCSVNELPKTLQSLKVKLLPLSFDNAKKVKIGFDVMDKMFSHNFYNLKMAILPTMLSSDKSVYSDIYKILENTTKGKISEIEESESNINDYLEDIAREEKHFPVLNTILFIDSPPRSKKYDLLLQIDDVLPSYISHVSDKMGYYNIKAFKNKDKEDAENTIYMQYLFSDRLEIMNILLSNVKINKDILIHKFSQLIYWGNINKKYAYHVDWSSYFSGYPYRSSIEAIDRYILFFNDTKKLKENFILHKEYSLKDVKEKKEKIRLLLENSEFLDNNDVLQSAYLLGMLSSALINWQYGISGNSSYNKWLNNSGAITKDTLDRIWKKAEETIRKLNSTSSSGNAAINDIRELVVESSQKAFIYEGIVKSSYVSLAFAMGGSDYQKHIKEDKKSKEEN